ncbi:TonB-dependent receptor [Gilvimarinus sp. DA14]|uniref:TonB-dependent receptor n=1 Tax=Gilvimarinus sp. DA14 TaxID=2956798 RepID=UPI0020B7F73A|nr:TonB-dependent receptor [Gilvimarinus sp. DA14]UTF59867.1 TonB-dependent receptor [Gilvimarinus sp. DA14]
MESNKGTFRRKVLASSISSCLLASAYMAQAQESDPMLEEVVVTGVYASQQNAIDAKRDSASVVDAISAEDIGKLPDVTIADSLQRIPGIQVERTAGEGGPVQIRGLGNVDTTLNGESFLSATTIDTVGADFGDLPSQLFSGAEVYKSARADLSSLGISGTIDLQTRRPFDLDEGWTFAGQAEVDHGTISDEYDPTVSGLIGYNAEKWGLLVSAVTTEKNLATDFNGYFDTSENGGIGATNNNHSWSTPAQDADVYHVIPQGFAAFHKEEERQRDGINASFQAQLTDGVELVADYFYSKQDRFNRRMGFSHNNRWQTFTDYAYAVDFGDNSFVDDSGNTWHTVNHFEARPYRVQSFTQVNRNTEESENASVELNFDNGGPLTGQVRITRADATASMRHGYIEGDMMSIDQNTLVTGPGGFIQSKYCDGNNHIEGTNMGENGGCYIEYAPGGMYGTDWRVTYDASGEHPVFGGFDQVVDGGQGEMTVADYMASIDSYHVGAISSENNTDDDGELNTFSTRWSYAFEETPFLSSIDFGVRQSERTVDHEVFSYFANFADTGCSAQWKAVDQFAGTSECDPNLPQGEYILDENGDRVQVAIEDEDGNVTGYEDLYENYTLVPPMRLDSNNDVIWMDDFGAVEGIPGVWVADPKAFDDTLAYQTRVFGEQTKFIQPGQSYSVGLDEFSYFLQANFEAGAFSGNVGVKVVETDLRVRQNVTGGGVPHSGVNYDVGDTLTERSYTDVLPAINLRYDITDNLVARFGYGETMQPLDLLQWGGAKSVGRVFNEECGCMRVTDGGSLSGNPDLDPTRADNTDLSIEWYLGNASALSAALFSINIDSFIQTGDIWIDEPDDDGVYRGPWRFSAPIQGTGGKVEGVELAAKVAFSDLTDGFMSNFGFDVNYTYSDSSQDAVGLGGEELPFVGNSEDTYNLVGWFENEFLSARLAYNFRSPRLITGGNAATGMQSLYQDDYGQLDMNVTWDVTDNVAVYLNGSNILEEYQQTYLEFEEQKTFQNIYEARWALGARVNF